MNIDTAIRSELEGMIHAPRAEALAELEQATYAAFDTRSEPSKRRRWLAGAWLSLLAGFALSPPGQALADRVGELVGIGEPAQIETRASETYGPVIVVGNGETPDGVPIQIVAFSGGEFDAPAGADDPFDRTQTCFGVDYPTVSGKGGNELCSDSPGALPVPGGFDNHRRFGVKGRYSLQGNTGANVAEVEVNYESSSGRRVSAPVVLARLDDALQQETGVPAGAGFFVAFLPDDGTKGDGFGNGSPLLKSVRIVAKDADGAVLKQLDYGARITRVATDRRNDEAATDRFVQRSIDAYRAAIDQLKAGASVPGFETADALAALKVMIDKVSPGRSAPRATSPDLDINGIYHALRRAGLLRGAKPAW